MTIQSHVREALETNFMRLHHEGLADGFQACVQHLDGWMVNLAGGRTWPHGAVVTTDTAFPTYSSGKALLAATFLSLVDRQLVSLEEPASHRLFELRAAEQCPELVLRHLLTHQAGIPDAERRVPAAIYARPEEALAGIFRLKPEWPAGTRVEYHSVTAAQLLSEVVRRVSGRDFHVECSEAILSPLSMRRTSFLRPPSDWTRVRAASRQAQLDVSDWTDSPSISKAVVPGTSSWSTASDLSRFYLAMLQGGRSWDGQQILRPETVDEARRLHAPFSRSGLAGFGLGFIVGVDPAEPMSYGLTASPHVFGHPGMACAQALADPERAVAMAFTTNVAPDQATSDLRFRQVIDDVLSVC